MNSTKHLSLILLITMAIWATGCSLINQIGEDCTSDNQCATLGPEFRCVQNLCVGPEQDADTDHTQPEMPGDLLGATCDQVIGVNFSNPLPDDAIIIGAIHPRTGDLNILGPYLEEATKMAVEEINEIGGIEGRPLVVVSCDSGTDEQTAIAAAQHLVDVANIKAVLGPFSSSIVIDVFNEVFRENDVVVVSAGANSPIMSTVSSEGLIWSTSLPAERQATAIANLLLDDTTFDFSKVAVIYRDDAWGIGMNTAMKDVYCQPNGPIDCLDSDVFAAAAYGVSDGDDTDAEIRNALNAINKFGPDVVVVLSYIQDAIYIFTTVALNIQYTFDRFIINDSIRDSSIFDEYLLEVVHPILCRTLGTTAAPPAGSVYSNFITNWRANTDLDDPVPYTTNMYDAVYLLTYAIAAATRESDSFSGSDVGRAMLRVSDGREIGAGTMQLIEGISTLRTSGETTIDYQGVSGDIDFVGSTGSIITPVQAYRMNVTEQEPEVLNIIFDNDGVYTPPDWSGVEDKECMEVRP